MRDSRSVLGVSLWSRSGRAGAVFVMWAALLVGCSSGGSGSGGGGSGGGPSDGDGAGDPPVGDGSMVSEPGQSAAPDNASLIIIPLGDRFDITLDNYVSFVDAANITGITITAVSADNETTILSLNATLLEAGEGSFIWDDLISGQRYHFSIALLYRNGSRSDIPIVFMRRDNRRDHAKGGIYLGANRDRDGQADAVDDDFDNDGIGDDSDNCVFVANSDQIDTNRDGDGDACDTDWDNDGIGNEDEVAGCALNPDCDGDSIGDRDDACPNGQMGWTSNSTNDGDRDGCHNDEDIDADGDGLIEIGTAEELNAVSYQLNGNGSRSSEADALNTRGCGNGVNITACNGYELTNDISLADYIAETNPIEGWQPIARNVMINDFGDCDGEGFSGIFDGNGFEISGLFINRSAEDCIGLFSRVSGTIRHLGVVADKVEGGAVVGGLVGEGQGASIIQSYVVSGAMVGNGITLGGLVGRSGSTSIIQSYAVSNSINGRDETGQIGGLVGWGVSTSIIQSYAVSNSVSGFNLIGGLIGAVEPTTTTTATTIVQSYAVSNSVNGRGGSGQIGGLVGAMGGLVGSIAMNLIVQSYAVSGSVNGSRFVGGLVGLFDLRHAKVSYWDIETSGRTNSATGSGQTTMALRSPTGYDGIYGNWSRGTLLDGIDFSHTIWCDEDLSGSIEAGEMRNNSHPDGDNRIWDFGSSSDYPAIRCTPDTLADQRAWWYLNRTTHKLQLNRTRFNQVLEGL